MNFGVTIVICTYNGAELLPATIEHIASQHVRPDIDWELIVVNNASSDNSTEIAKSEWAKYQCAADFKVLYQPKPGLSYARELAIEEAAYEFILFCDDDNWLGTDYVSVAYDVMMEQPQVGMLGGHGELIFASYPPPHWATHLSIFAAGPQAKTSGKVHNNVVYGAGCVMRKSAYSVVKNAGFTSMLTDRKGNALSAGGDIELCFIIALAGYEIWYEENLKFKHFMPKKRLNSDYYIQYYKDGAKSFEVLMPYRIRVNLGGKNKVLFYIMLLRIWSSYVLKLSLIKLKKLFLSIDEASYETLSLQVIGLEYKLSSFRRFRQMQYNFAKILGLERALKQGSKYVQFQIT